MPTKDIHNKGGAPYAVQVWLNAYEIKVLLRQPTTHVF